MNFHTPHAPKSDTIIKRLVPSRGRVAENNVCKDTVLRDKFCKRRRSQRHRCDRQSRFQNLVCPKSKVLKGEMSKTIQNTGFPMPVFWKAVPQIQGLSQQCGRGPSKPSKLGLKDKTVEARF